MKKDTLGDLIIKLIGYIPANQEEKVIEYRNVFLKLDKVEENRIDKVNICLMN